MSAPSNSVPGDTSDAFEARYGRAALFDRYVRSRFNQFWVRQVATLIGAVYLGGLFSPLLALIAVGLTLFGEGLDLLVLRRAQQWRRAGLDFEKIILRTTLAGAVQGITIAGSTLLLLLSAPTQAVELVGMCFLMAAAVNAGFALTHHPPVSWARLGVFAACAIGFVIKEALEYGGLNHKTITHIVEATLLGYMTYTFVSFSVRSWGRRLASERALMSSAQHLDHVNQELARQEHDMRQLSLVARYANDSVILFDPDLTIKWVNEAFTSLTGYSPEEAVGRKAWDILGGQGTCSEPQSEFAEQLRKPGAIQARMLSYTKSGEKIWFDINRVPIYGADGQVETLISVERDATQLEEHAQELARAMYRAEEGARAKSIFLATMSHEIRTPLNAIVGMTDLLADEDLDAGQTDYVETIQNASHALLLIINDVLEYSRLEADHVALDPAPAAPLQTVEAAVSLLQTMAREKGLFLKVDSAENLPPAACFDAGRLRQIIVNLVGNAIKFTSTGGVTVGVKAKSASEGWTLVIQVTDTGIGVPQDRTAQIFQEFQQADASITRRFGGTGLGLPISLALARRMGGDLVLRSSGNSGSVFEVSIAMQEAATSELTNDSDAITALPKMQNPIRVLLAEDNETNRLLVTHFLKGQPVELIEAINGREAVERAAKDRPDVVLMDMSMPELDGLAATRAIRALDIQQPYIAALTANAFASDKEACLAAGMDDFVTKPLRRSQLIEALHRALNSKNSLSKPGQDGLSRPGAEREADSWTSPPASGTTNGRSTRSSGH